MAPKSRNTSSTSTNTQISCHHLDRANQRYVPETEGWDGVKALGQYYALDMRGRDMHAKKRVCGIMLMLLSLCVVQGVLDFGLHSNSPLLVEPTIDDDTVYTPPPTTTKSGNETSQFGDEKSKKKSEEVKKNDTRSKDSIHVSDQLSDAIYHKAKKNDTRSKDINADISLELKPIEIKWQDRLYAPTFVTHCGGLYFIVDCWHHRILYSDQWGANLSEFASIDGLGGPHSVACNGRIAMMEDTGKSSVRAYALTDLQSSLQNRSLNLEYQRLGTNRRPHRTLYDEFTTAFYVICARGDLYKFRDENTTVTQVSVNRQVAGSDCGYTRSFTIVDNELLVACESRKIRRIQYREDFQVLGSYPSPGSLNDVYRASSGWWYLTSHFDGFWRVPSLDDLVEKNGTIIASQKENLGFRGVPYYISEVAGRLIVPQVASPRAWDESAIVSFRDGVNETELKDKRVIWSFGPPQRVDVKRKRQFST